MTVVPTLPWHTDDVRPMWDLYIYTSAWTCEPTVDGVRDGLAFMGVWWIPVIDTSYFAQDLMKERMVRLSMNVS